MIVLVPAYEPDDRLLELLADLAPHPVVVVDDGSGDAYRPVFDAAAALGADVLGWRRNHGKGAALKAGVRAHRAVLAGPRRGLRGQRRPAPPG